MMENIEQKWSGPSWISHWHNHCGSHSSLALSSLSMHHSRHWIFWTQFLPLALRY